MFKNTIAVGPLDTVVVRVVGGATVAMFDRCPELRAAQHGTAREKRSLDVRQPGCGRFVTSLRNAIVYVPGAKMLALAAARPFCILSPDITSFEDRVKRICREKWMVSCEQ